MADGPISTGIEIGKKLDNVVESLERLAKEYTKPLEKFNKVSGGFGIGLTKFGTLNAKIDILSDRIDLNTKQNKSLLAFETTFAKVLNSNNKDIQRLQEQYGPKILSDTLLDAFSAGGPILADALDLGAMMTAVGKDPAKMFKFLNEFKSITGFGIKEQRMLVTSLKNNFSRQDALIDALESLTSTLQQAAQISPELPKNITTLVDQIAESFPGLEKQFADLFKKFLADPTISRGYLGPELANANRDMVQKLLANQATKDDILSFIEKITNSSEVKAREELFKKQALQTGLLPDSLTALTTMLGEFVAEARQTNSAVTTFTDQMSSPDLIAKDKLSSDKLLPSILNQLDITLEKVNRTITLSTEDLTLLQTALGKLMPGFPQMSSDILTNIPEKVDKIAQTANDLTFEQLKNLRSQEEQISDFYTAYRQAMDIASTTVEIGNELKDMMDTLKQTKERGTSCANPMYVVICGEGKKTTPPVPVSGKPKPAEAPSPKTPTPKGKSAAPREPQPRGPDGRFRPKPPQNTPGLPKGKPVGGPWLPLIPLIWELYRTSNLSKEEKDNEYRQQAAEDAERLVSMMGGRYKSVESIDAAILENRRAIAESEKWLSENKNTLGPDPWTIWPSDQRGHQKSIIEREEIIKELERLRYMLQNEPLSFVLPENSMLLNKLDLLKTEVAKVSSTIIQTRYAERYNGVTESA